MRHGKRVAKLGVRTKHRRALLRNLIRNLVIYKRIRTTVAKARAASAFADRLIQFAKKGDLSARRTLISYLGCPQTADTLIKKIAPHFKERQGGYTRVLRIGDRIGDAAELAILEFSTPIPVAPKPAKKKKEKKSETKPAALEEKEVKPKSKKVKEPAEEVKADKKDKDQTDEEKKESEKKGGFLGALRKFLKGDDK